MVGWGSALWCQLWILNIPIPINFSSTLRCRADFVIFYFILFFCIDQPVFFCFFFLFFFCFVFFGFFLLSRVSSPQSPFPNSVFRAVHLQLGEAAEELEEAQASTSRCYS